MKKLGLCLVLMVMGLMTVNAQWWTDNRSSGMRALNDSMEKAVKVVPFPQVNNFAERQNVTRRAREFDVPMKMGYLYVFVPGAATPLGYYTVIGKVSSLRSYLYPQEVVVGGGSAGYATVSTADVDGTWGENIEGWFCYTTEGTYV